MINNEQVIQYYGKIESIVNKFADILGSEPSILSRELSVDSVAELKNNIAKRENVDRTLQIGIVGRVKSGKSSLLNSLFFDGKTVLPKAATPMTAALTALSYGNKLSVEVEFFTEQDIDNIKAEHEKCKQQLKKIVDQKVEKETERIKKENRIDAIPAAKKSEIKKVAEEKALKQIKIENSVLSAAYEQYEKIQQFNLEVK
jgi:hypothetical protein